MSKQYLIWTGFVFALLAFLELVYRDPFNGLLRFTPIHNVFNWVIAAALLGIYATRQTRAERIGALLAGALFTLVVAVTWLAPARVSDLIGYPLSLPYKLIHLASAAAGLAIGIFDREEKGTRDGHLD
jgi:hypothetical protein